MDLFSHALLPYLLGKSFKRKKEEVTAFVLGGIAPDIDVFIMWINLIYPTSFLITHRGITHSLFFGFFTGIAVLYLATNKRIKTKIKRSIDFEPLITGRTVMFAFAGVVIHLFLDYVTTRGVPLFYPLISRRYSAEVFFYTDIYLTILSLMIIIFLYKKPQFSASSAKFLVIFLIVFAGLGTLRIGEKMDAKSSFQETDLKAYPTMSPFDWYLLGEDADTIKIYEYKGFERSSAYIGEVKRINVLSPGEDLRGAMAVADELPQVQMFRWRVYAVAVNASFDEQVWSLEYYDPMQRAMARDMPGIFKGFARGLGSTNVTVNGSKAVIS